MPSSQTEPTRETFISLMLPGCKHTLTYPMPLMNLSSRKSQNHGAKLARPPNSPLMARETTRTLRRPLWSARYPHRYPPIIMPTRWELNRSLMQVAVPQFYCLFYGHPETRTLNFDAPRKMLAVSRPMSDELRCRSQRAVGRRNDTQRISTASLALAQPHTSRSSQWNRPKPSGRKGRSHQLTKQW